MLDPAPDAYERLIDRLLASQHYGEHWGKYWLDAAGYADSNGKIDRDTIRPDAWRYRDYVIRSLNADKRYDQFLIEQIAGDELFDFKAAHKLTPQQQDYLIATGFLRTAPDNTDEAAINLVPFRLSVLNDQFDIFSSAVMGLTMGCARCHNHKYDPIPQRDYYRLSAIFQAAYDPYDWLISSQVIYAGGEPKADVADQYQRFLPYVAEEEVGEVEDHNAPIHKEITTIERLVETKAQPFRDKLIGERLAKLPESVRQDLTKALATPEQKRNSLEKYLVEKFGPLFEVEIKDLKKQYPEFKEEADQARGGNRRSQAKTETPAENPGAFRRWGRPSSGVYISPRKLPKYWPLGRAGGPLRVARGFGAVQDRQAGLDDGHERSPSGAGQVAHPAQPPAHHPSNDQPDLAIPFRNRPREHSGQLRQDRIQTLSPGIVGLVVHRVCAARMEPEGHAPPPPEFGGIPPELDGKSGSAGSRPG